MPTTTPLRDAVPDPLSPPPLEGPPVTPPELAVGTTPGLDDDIALTLAIAELRKLRRSRRNLLLRHLMAMLRIHAAQCAVAVKYVQPYLTDAEVAELCNKSVRQLRRYSEYEAFRPDVADAKDRLRRQSYMSAELEA